MYGQDEMIEAIQQTGDHPPLLNTAHPVALAILVAGIEIASAIRSLSGKHGEGANV